MEDHGKRQAGARLPAHEGRPQAPQANRTELGDAQRRRPEGTGMDLKNWFRKRPSAGDMCEEIESHLAMRAEHDGSDASTARRRFGNTLYAQEEVRHVWIAPFWDTLLQDARFTWRSWRRNPGFAVMAILTLALGLGASTALFSALDRILFRSLPYPHADRLVSVGIVLPNSSSE